MMFRSEASHAREKCTIQSIENHMIHFFVLFMFVVNSTTVREGDFVLVVRQVAGFVDGPHVVELNVVYVGDSPVVIRRMRESLQNTRLKSLVPSFSTFSFREIDTDAPLWEEVHVDKGKGVVCSDIYHLHHSSQVFPTQGLSVLAEASLNYWPTQHGKPKGEPVVVTLRKKLILTRTKPTANGLAGIRGALLTRVLRCDSDASWQDCGDQNWQECFEWLLNTRYKELCPVAIRMLDATRFADREWFSFEYVVNCTGSIEETNCLLVAELQKPALASASVFVAWKHPKFKIPSERQIQSLLAAPNPWVRGLAAAAFSTSLRSEQRKVAFAAVRDHLNPEPSPDFLGLIAQLDDPRFQIRENATKKLATMGEGVEAMALRALRNAPSPEVEQRLKSALGNMQTLEPLTESFRAIRALERMSMPAAEELLQVIAEGPPGLRSTQEAKKTIARLKEQSSPQHKLEGKGKK